MAGPTMARAVSRAASFVFFLLDQAGRPGLGGRHSTARVAVVSAARLPAHSLAPDVAEHASNPFEEAVVARSEVRDEARGLGRLVPAHLHIVIANQANAWTVGRIYPAAHSRDFVAGAPADPGARQSWRGDPGDSPRMGTAVLFLDVIRSNYSRIRSSLGWDIRWRCERGCSAHQTEDLDRCRAVRG